MSFAVDLLLALLWVGGAIALVLMVHWLARRLMPATAAVQEDGHQYPAAARDMAQATGFRIAAFYGVILAMVYAHELSEYQSVREGLANEAIAIADVYHDAYRHGGELAPVVQGAMVTYVRFVIDREWMLLGTEQRLSVRAWAARDIAYDAVLDSVSQSPRQEWLRTRMLQRLGDITADRHMRQELAAKDFGLVFWIPAIAGLILVSIPFYVFPPTRETRIMLACFGAFAGVILFFIQGFASPFSRPFNVPPGAFLRLLETDMNKTASLVLPMDAPVGAAAGQPTP
jgi:hypothetical protein